jgi:hypothetical protein
MMITRANSSPKVQFGLSLASPRVAVSTNQPSSSQQPSPTPLGILKRGSFDQRAVDAAVTATMQLHQPHQQHQSPPAGAMGILKRLSSSALVESRDGAAAAGASRIGMQELPATMLPADESPRVSGRTPVSSANTSPPFVGAAKSPSPIVPFVARRGSSRNLVANVPLVPSPSPPTLPRVPDESLPSPVAAAYSTKSMAAFRDMVSHTVAGAEGRGGLGAGKTGATPPSLSPRTGAEGLSGSGTGTAPAATLAIPVMSTPPSLSPRRASILPFAQPPVLGTRPDAFEAKSPFSDFMRGSSLSNGGGLVTTPASPRAPSLFLVTPTPMAATADAADDEIVVLHCDPEEERLGPRAARSGAVGATVPTDHDLFGGTDTPFSQFLRRTPACAPTATVTVAPDLPVGQLTDDETARLQTLFRTYAGNTFGELSVTHFVQLLAVLGMRDPVRAKTLFNAFHVPKDGQASKGVIDLAQFLDGMAILVH